MADINKTHTVIGLEFRTTAAMELLLKTEELTVDVGALVNYRRKGDKHHKPSSGAPMIKVTACNLIEITPTGKLSTRNLFGKTLPHDHPDVPLTQALDLMPLLREIKIRDAKRHEEMKRKADIDTMKENLRLLETTRVDNECEYAPTPVTPS